MAYGSRKPSFITSYKETGCCEIDINLVVVDWLRIPHLWMVSEYRGDYRLVRFARKNSEITNLKVNISMSTFIKLRKRIDLKRIRSDPFKNACTYIKDEE